MRAVLLLSCILHLAPLQGFAQVAAQSPNPPTMRSNVQSIVETTVGLAHRELCKGQIKEGLSQLDKLLRNQPSNLRALELRRSFLVEEDNHWSAAMAEKVRRELNPLSDEERLSFATVALMMEDGSLIRIKEWLSQPFAAPQWEAQRLYLEAATEAIQGNPEQQYQKLRQALHFDPLHLGAIIAIVHWQRLLKADASSVFENSLQAVNRLDEQDPLKLIYEYYLWRGMDPSRKYSDLQKIRLAYGRCSQDQTIAQIYALLLAEQGEKIQGYSILSGSLKNRKYYSPSRDVELALMGVDFAPWPIIEDHLLRAQRHRHLIGSSWFPAIDEGLRWVEQKRAQQRTTWALAAVLVVLISGLIIWLRRLGKRTPSYHHHQKTQIDESVLRRAELHLVTQPHEEWVTVATFASTDGYSEEMLMDMVAHLQSEGVATTYQSFSVGSGFGALTQYHLQTTLEHTERCRELLQDWNQKSKG